MHEAGQSVDDISAELGRQPGGVRARIKKYFGDDALVGATK